MRHLKSVCVSSRVAVRHLETERARTRVFVVIPPRVIPVLEEKMLV